MSDTAWLLVLFIVLPMIVAPIVIALVARRSPSVPVEHRTSWLLANGEPVRGHLVSWKNKGPFLLDSRPMVAFTVSIDDEVLEVTQSVPRDVIATLTKGLEVEVRRSPDRRAGAIVFE